MSTNSLLKPTLVLTKGAKVSHFEWLKQIKREATAKGVHLCLGFDRLNKPPTARLSRVIREKLEDRIDLNSREQSQLNDHTKYLTKSQTDCAEALALVDKYCDEEVCEHIRTVVPDYAKPKVSKLRQIVEELEDACGGIYSAI